MLNTMIMWMALRYELGDDNSYFITPIHFLKKVLFIIYYNIYKYAIYHHLNKNMNLKWNHHLNKNKSKVEKRCNIAKCY